MVGVVAGNNVLRGPPSNRTSMGAALVDTSSELATGIGIAATGTILAALFTGNIASKHWTTGQITQFRDAITISGLTLTVVAAALVGFGIARSRRGAAGQAPTTPVDNTVLGTGRSRSRSEPPCPSADRHTRRAPRALPTSPTRSDQPTESHLSHPTPGRNLDAEGPSSCPVMLKPIVSWTGPWGTATRR